MNSLTAYRRPSLAHDVMTQNPTSVNEISSIREVAAFLLAKRMSAAPVIDEAGRAVGVVSLSDIVRHSVGDESSRSMNLPVSAIMNDEILFVRPGTPIDNVIDDLLRCKVKRMFVADEKDVLVGVISSTDVLRYVNSLAAQPPLRQAVYATGRRPVPSLPRRPAPFATTPRTGSDIVLAGAR